MRESYDLKNLKGRQTQKTIIKMACTSDNPCFSDTAQMANREFPSSIKYLLYVKMLPFCVQTPSLVYPGRSSIGITVDTTKFDHLVGALNMEILDHIPYLVAAPPSQSNETLKNARILFWFGGTPDSSAIYGQRTGWYRNESPITSNAGTSKLELILTSKQIEFTDIEKSTVTLYFTNKFWLSTLWSIKEIIVNKTKKYNSKTERIKRKTCSNSK